MKIECGYFLAPLPGCCEVKDQTGASTSALRAYAQHERRVSALLLNPLALSVP
jgi:hypothetical protein